MNNIIDNDSPESFRFGEFNPARAILAPLLKGEAVVLSVATDATQKRIDPFLFIMPVSIFKNLHDAQGEMAEKLANSVNQDYLLAMGMPGGKMQIVDVNDIKRNSLYLTGMSMRAAKMLQAELEDLFGIDADN